MFTSRVNQQKLCVSMNLMFTFRQTHFCLHLVDSTYILMLLDKPTKCQQSTFMAVDDRITMMLLYEPQKCRQSSRIHATNMFTFEKNFHSNEHKSHTFRQPICSHYGLFLLQCSTIRRISYNTCIVLVIICVMHVFVFFLHSTLLQRFIHVYLCILRAKPVLETLLKFWKKLRNYIIIKFWKS